MKSIFKPCLLFLAVFAWIACIRVSMAQTQALSIDTCYRLARIHYPLIVQEHLIEEAKDYTIRNINAGNLPQVGIYGRATYQSAVTEIPIHLPSVKVPELSKDQYRVYAELSQSIYDGGTLRAEREMAEAGSRLEARQLEVTLYRLKARIDELFFGMMLLNEKLAENSLYQQDIQAGLRKVIAAVDNGSALKSNRSKLEAELLAAEQQATELHAQRLSFARMLGIFIGRPVPDTVGLEAAPKAIDTSGIARPEIEVFRDRSTLLHIQDKMLSAANRPKVNFFVDGGAGRPGLDMLDNRFRAYYIGGVNLSLPLSGFYTLRRKRALLDVNRQELASERETFLFQTRQELTGEQTAFEKNTALIDGDEKIIALRTQIKETSLAQLEQGAITSDDYLRDIHALDQARQQMSLHRVERLMNAYQAQTTAGH